MTGKRDGRRQEADDGVIVPDTPEKLSFVNGLIARGEAVHAQDGMPLPSGATHVIVGQTEQGGLPIVKRVRFSSF